MGTKLNPDGTKIRALRIQRGWTQEQLAAIAGISLRTIQRAEAASCAAFETMKAIAAAFETDFDQLIKTEPGTAPHQEKQMASTTQVPCSGQEFDPIVVERRAPPVQRRWTVLLTAVCALAAGLLTGVVLTSRLDKPAESPSPVPQIVSVPTSPIRDSHESSQLNTRLMQAASVQRTVPDPMTKTAIPNPKSAGMDEKPGLASSAIQVAETSDPADSLPLEFVQQPTSLDLPRQSQDLLEPLVIPETTVDWSVLSVLSGDSTLERQDPGAVRQAMGVAAKKTSAFVSKASASIKRVF